MSADETTENTEVAEDPAAVEERPLLAEIHLGDLDRDEAHLALQMMLSKFADQLEKDASVLRMYGQGDTADALLRLRSYGIGYADGLVKAILADQIQPGL